MYYCSRVLPYRAKVATTAATSTNAKSLEDTKVAAASVGHVEQSNEEMPVISHIYLAVADSAVRAGCARVFNGAAPIPAVPGSTIAFAGVGVAGVVVLAGKVAGASGAALASVALLAFIFLAVESLLAHALAVNAIATRATVNVAGPRHLGCALVTVKTGVTQATSLGDFGSVLVGACPLVAALLLGCGRTACAGVARAGIGCQALTVGQFEADKLTGHLLLVDFHRVRLIGKATGVGDNFHPTQAIAVNQILDASTSRDAVNEFQSSLSLRAPSSVTRESNAFGSNVASEEDRTTIRVEAPLQNQVSEHDRDQHRGKHQQLGRLHGCSTVGGACRAVEGGVDAHIAQRARGAAQGAVACRRTVGKNLASANAAIRACRARVLRGTASVTRVARAADAFARFGVARVAILAGQVVCAASATLVGLALLAVVRLAVETLLAHALAGHTVTTGAAVDVTRVGNLLLALVAVETGVAHAAALGDLLLVLVRAGALVSADLLRVGGLASGGLARGGVRGLVGAVGNIQAHELAGHRCSTNGGGEHAGRAAAAACRRRRGRCRRAGGRGDGRRSSAATSRGGVADVSALVRRAQARRGAAACWALGRVGRALGDDVAVDVDRDAGRARVVLLAVRVRRTVVGRVVGPVHTHGQGGGEHSQRADALH
ncbi:hypothetical protein ON010_g8846 [Phytophthora cinnamomi]|nr:hypothetical protein ON010_g8846 [Phytophthora cinnamomi]